jgi:hypothetical protein
MLAFTDLTVRAARVSCFVAGFQKSFILSEQK